MLSSQNSGFEVYFSNGLTEVDMDYRPEGVVFHSVDTFFSLLFDDVLARSLL